MKAPNSFTIRPDHGGKAPKKELASWRVDSDGKQVFLILYKFNKQFAIVIPKEEANDLAIKLMTASEPEPTQDGGFAG